MKNKFDEAIKNRSKEILNAGKLQEKNTLSTDTNAAKNNEKIMKFDLDSIIDKKQTESKNKSYYLEVKVTNTVKKIAKQQGVSESKLVNDILKHILNIK